MKLSAGICIVLLVAGCATPSAIEVDAPTPTPTHENLNSVLWVQTSVEYAAVARQAYDLAERTLEEALADPSWTASLEQHKAGGYEELPPAVVLDVDETVLDNSAFQARLILDGTFYNTDIWNDWVREEAAPAVPGALEYTRAAEEMGAAIIYLTNRRSVVEDATRRNLEALGFPLVDDEDVILTRGEREEWAASDKTPRREAVAQTYRIVQLVGDNLGDFVELENLPPNERQAAVTPYADYWGTRWIMLPNPQYGSWEEAVIDYDFSVPHVEQLRRKRGSLEPAR